jgi:hypothetical protein
MSLSPYTDPILDYLADQEPHTVAEIREGIGARDGAGIPQLLRNLMWTLAEQKDERKLIAGRRGGSKTYQIVPRDPRKPILIPEE